jgi:ribosomal protein S6--L-glutamate ligase
VSAPVTRTGHVRIGFLLRAETPGAGPYLSAVTQDVVNRLRERGATVDLILPENTSVDIGHVRPAHDLYVLKEKSPLILAFAGALTVAGAVVVNTFASCRLTRDKIAATAVLAGAGVPVPPSWTTASPSRVRPLVDDGPLWLKASRGSRGAGVSRVTDPRAVDEQPAPTDVHGLPLPIFAQREVPSTGRDLKVFVVGEEMWAITRPFPARTMAEKLGTPVAVRSDIRMTALACGRALGLELYGVDVLEADGRFWVVDVNALPGYKGAVEAPRALAEHLYTRARRAARGGDA